MTRRQNSTTIFPAVAVFSLTIFFGISFVPRLMKTQAAYYQTNDISTQTLALDLNNGYYEQSAFLVPYDTMDIEVADFDNDGCKDAALSTFYNTQHKIFWSNCDGTYTASDALGTGTGWGIDSADFNNDGFLDIVIGHYPGFGGPAGNYLYINNKDRTFTQSTMFGNGNTTNLQVQDINNDGLPDVIVPSANQSYTYTNNGNGTFTSHTLLSPVNTMNLKMFDIDKDGYLDVLKSEYSSWTTYNINRGDGTYTPHNVTTNVVSDMQPIDFNKDGNWDFTVAVQGQSYLYVNNGDGTWTQTSQFGTGNTNVHVIKDIDGNGYDDVVAANGAWGSFEQNYVYYNNGDGTFTRTPMFGTRSTYAMHFVDVDGDGDEDVVNGNWTSNGNEIFYKGYYPVTTKTYSFPVTIPSDFVSWDHLDVAEEIKIGTDIQYTVYPEDKNNDGICNDGAAITGPVGSNNGEIAIASVPAQPICVMVTLNSNRVIATPKLTSMKVTYAADSSAPAGLTLDSPAGYTKDTKPTLLFKKAADTASGMASYTVSLDEGKAKGFSLAGIPANGDISKSIYVWKNDSSVKVVFTNEDDNDQTNDNIGVYFKNLDANDLAEGRHSWRVTAYDNAGNAKDETKEFFIDRTNPNISELNWTNAGSLPTFSGRATDSYHQGDTDYDKVSSGPRTISLNLKKINSNNLFADYVTKDVTLSQITDVTNDQKYTHFTVAPPDPLSDGLYQATLTLRDEAGNEYSYAAIDVPVNYAEPTLTPVPVQKTDIEAADIPAPTAKPEPTKEPDKKRQDSVVVQIKVMDKDGKPVYHARVELRSDPMVAYTDENGIATFENVPTGEHTVNISYANYQGKQKLILAKDNTKHFSFDIKVTEVAKPDYSRHFLAGIVAVLASVIGWLTYKRKLSRRGQGQPER